MKTTIALFAAIAAFTSSASEPAALENGGIWKDTDGVHINAHGGGLMRDGGIWYWYGEHKTEGKAGNKAWVGVSCYSSVNLTDWRREGIAFAVSKDPSSPVAEGCILERPKVVKAQDGSGYAMFFHLEPKGMGYKGAHTGIAKSKTPTGPFELVWSGRPNAGKKPITVPGAEEYPLKGGNGWKVKTPWGEGFAKEWLAHLEGGQMSRDMTLYTDPADGTVYHIFASEDNSCLHVAELMPDALGYTGKWARITPGEWTEAPAVVKHGEWYFLIGSGCTGWRPNAARYYRAKSIWGPWQRMENPTRGVNPANRLGPELTWGGQSTGIFEIVGTAYAMFDIWRPDNAIDGRYVWLPIDFKNDGTITITWRESFKPAFKKR